MKVVEIIGRTIQGEGKYIGLPMAIVRLYGCDLNCTWCDTKYERNQDFEEMSVNEIVKNLKLRNVMVTGGEPVIQDEFTMLLGILEGRGHRVHVETNGMRLKKEWASRFNDVVWAISPKLRSSGNKINYKKRYEVFTEFLNCSLREAFLKFVITEEVEKDIDEAIKIVDWFGSFWNQVYFQPVDNNEFIYREMIKYGPDGVRYLFQLHKIMGMQ